MTDTQTENQDFEAAFTEASGDGTGTITLPADPEPTAPDSDELDQGEPAADDAAGDGEGGQEEAAPEGEGDNDNADPWAEAPEPLRAEYEALQAKYRDIDHRYRSDTGRISALNRKYAETQRENDELKRQLAAQSNSAADTKNGNAQGDDTEDTLKTLREEYPEVAEPIEKILKASQMKADALDQRLAQMDEERQKSHIITQQEYLSEQHSDWQQIGASDEFHAWVGGQPRMIQDALARNSQQIVDGEEAAAVIALFKQSLNADQGNGGEPTPQPEPEQKPTISKRDLQRKSAAAPISRTTTGGGDGPADDFGASFNFYSRQDQK